MSCFSGSDSDEITMRAIWQQQDSLAGKQQTTKCAQVHVHMHNGSV